VQAPTVQTNSPVTVCNYGSGSISDTVIIRYQTAMTQSTFNTGKAGFSSHGESTNDASGIGDAAYSSTIGTGQAVINTLVVLKGSIEVLVTAPASLAQIDSLVGQILPKL
jgi:hypothetical protein